MKKHDGRRKPSKDAYIRLRELGFSDAGLRCYQSDTYRVEFTGGDWAITDRKTERTVNTQPTLGMVVLWIESQEIKNL